MNTKKPFVDREFKLVPGGNYDQNGFYVTPNGSFWDPDGVYFNREGVDKHGGFYGTNFEYQPGITWIEELMCYEDEKEEVLKRMGMGLRAPGQRKGKRDDDEFPDEEGDECNDILDDLYDNIDYDKAFREQEQLYDNQQQILPKDRLIFQPLSLQEKNKIATIEIQQEVQVITPDLLFNKIPENKIPQQHSSATAENKVPERKENKIEVDSLFK